MESGFNFEDEDMQSIYNVIEEKNEAVKEAKEMFKITQMCWETCHKSNEQALTQVEKVCISNCTKNIFEASEFQIKRMAEED